MRAARELVRSRKRPVLLAVMVDHPWQADHIDDRPQAAELKAAMSRKGRSS